MTGSSPTQKRIPSGHKMSACRRVRARERRALPGVTTGALEGEECNLVRPPYHGAAAGRPRHSRPPRPVWPQSVWFHGGPVRAKGKVFPGCPSSAPATGARHGQAMRTLRVLGQSGAQHRRAALLCTDDDERGKRHGLLLAVTTARRRGPAPERKGPPCGCRRSGRCAARSARRAMTGQPLRTQARSRWAPPRKPSSASESPSVPG